MKLSSFETARYAPPQQLPASPGAYDPETGTQAYLGMVERERLVEELGFNWVSLFEHHYSPRILTPNIVVSGSCIAAGSRRIKIAVLALRRRIAEILDFRFSRLGAWSIDERYPGQAALHGCPVSRNGLW